MRKHLLMILPAVLAVSGLIACDVPDDGFSELEGTIMIPNSLVPLVVQPSNVGAGSDCDPEADKGWGETTSIGDIVPTLYVGLYKRPIEPLQDNLFVDVDETTWRQGCGEIDDDNDPVTPTVHREGSCPIGGSTATYQQTTTGSNGGAIFTFEALQLPKRTVYLMAWLDNRCAADNEASANLVWDIAGPPGPLDKVGENAVDDGAAFDENDIGIVTPLEVKIGGGSNKLDDVLVLNSALNLSSLGL